MHEIEAVAEALIPAQEVLITSHLVPDGDSIGALIGLALGLKQLGKGVHLCTEDEVPRMYRFLEGWERIVRPAAVDPIPDTVVLVDCTGLTRVGNQLFSLLQGHPNIINLDHHTSNEFFGRINWVDEKAGASAEMVYDLLRKLGVAIDRPIANAIYTGIITDTGSFRFSSTTSRTMRIAAELMDAGIDQDEIRIQLFETHTLEMLRLLGESLRTLQVDPNGRLAWISVSQETLCRLKVKDDYGLFEGLINYPRSIEGVEVAILFREIAPSTIKVGFRSKSWLDVNQLAATYGGGGHRKAAGCVIEGGMDEVVERVLTQTREVLRNHSGD